MFSQRRVTVHLAGVRGHNGGWEYLEYQEAANTAGEGIGEENVLKIGKRQKAPGGGREMSHKGGKGSRLH